VRWSAAYELSVVWNGSREKWLGVLLLDILENDPSDDVREAVRLTMEVP
jgi:hypothetical protein